MTDKECRFNELSALESIYNSEELRLISDNDTSGGQFYAFPDVSPDFKIIYKDLRKEESDATEVTIKYLPPLVLYFSLPSDYPSTSPPNFTLSCKWLMKTEILRLCRKLDDIWEENKGMEILFLWTQFLKEDSLKFLGCEEKLDLSDIYTSHLKFLANRKADCLPNVTTVSSCKQNSNQDAIHKPTSSSSDNIREFKQTDTEKRLPTNDTQKKVGENWTQKKFSHHDNQRRFSQHESQKRYHQNYGERRFVQTADMERRFKNHNYNRNFSGRGRRGYRGGWRHPSNWENRPEYTHSSPPGVSGGYKTEDKKMTKHKDMRTETEERTEAPKNSSHQDSLRQDSLPQNSLPQDTPLHDTLPQDSLHPDTPPQDTLPQDTLLEDSNSQLNKLVQDIDEGARAVLDISPLFSVVRVVTEYNKTREEEIFKRNFYTCKICYQDKLGAQSTKFEPCGHVFCRDCVSSYLEVRIKDGTVHNIGCPEDKCTSEATAIQVQGLVSQDLFEKYDSVLLSAMIDSMEDVIYCPRSFCQHPTTGDPNEKMATCPACNYVFCIYCKMVYHGVEPCRLKSGKREQLVNEYLSADLKQKEELELRYGKKQIRLLVDNTMSEQWITDNSKNCPQCNAAIEKSDGCNKMICWKCNTYFCWICSARLNPQSPYTHFSDRTSNCFNMLFHNMAVLDPDMDDIDDEHLIGAYLDLVM